MTAQRVFGRRNVAPQREFSRARGPARQDPPEPPAVVDTPLESSVLPPPHPAATQFDEELRQWKQTRRQAYKIPWRQLTLMASLCFGIAALVLPDTISSGLDWLLYAMMAAGFYTGLRRRTS